MPIKIPNKLPASKNLRDENIFVMTEERAIHQDIRPLKIAIFNLMPTKIVTETQLCRVLSNTPLQIEIDLVHFESHLSKNTDSEHLAAFYKTFSEIQHNKYDGIIVTGAPVEQLAFEEVDYWHELIEVMDWADKHGFSSLYICWAAQAALNHFFGVPKYHLKEKMFGVFSHKVTKERCDLVRGFDDIFYAPHSRHTEIKREDILKIPDLQILAESAEAGVYIVRANNRRQVFVTGHSEYDPLTLKAEYDRDVVRNLSPNIPTNYFLDNDPSQEPLVLWRGHGQLLFSNWINCIYQETPYDLSKI